MTRVGYAIPWEEIGDEEWRLVASNPNYEVSELGQVRNRNTRVVLRPYFSGGFLRVTLPGPKYVSIHVLVCEAFHGPPPTPEHEVDHKDVDWRNNRASNLEWVTRAENNRRYRAYVAAVNNGRRLRRPAVTAAVHTSGRLDLDEFGQEVVTSGSSRIRRK